MERIKTDVLIIGAGAAGLFAALHLPRELDVVVVDKGKLGGGGSSPWAQGGVAAALGPDDSPDLHAADTLRVAAGHGDVSAVAVLCSEAPECVMELAELGCDFARGEDGSLHLAREGGQSVARSAHSDDATGAAIMTTLRDRARDLVTRIEGSCLQLCVVGGRCTGGWVLTEDGLVEVAARSTVLATGGIGALFTSTTNPLGATGDGHVLAWEAGAGLADIEFVQFHPTALALGGSHQRLLLTEALRGAGAHVVDSEGRRFLFGHHSDAELAPRDVVARAIASRHSWLDCRHIDPDVLEEEFPTVLEGVRTQGLDLTKDLIPVQPAAHYFMGGIETDLDGRSSIPRLYAIGECSNTGVHGANRLAGNSLAEALVFGRRAAKAIAGQRMGPTKGLAAAPLLQEVEIDSSASSSRHGSHRRNSDASVDAGWDRLREVCSGALGIQRDPKVMASVASALEDLAILPLTGSSRAAELRAGAILVRLMARVALLRTESRGCHYRTDYPSPDPDWAGVRLRVSRS